VKKDLLAKTPMDLVKMLNVSLPKAESILDHAFKCSPVNPINVNNFKKNIFFDYEFYI
jgi:hypothetical protein